MKEIVFYARGGQGAVTAAAVLVAALAKEGKYAQAFPFFGGERRGAPVKAFLRIDDKPVTTRSQIYRPDCIIVLDSKLPSSMNVYDGLKQGGIAVFNSHLSPSDIKTKVPLSKIGTVDANQIADDIFGSMAIPFTNFAMLGAFAAATGWVGLDSIIEASYYKFTGNTAKNNEKSTRGAFAATQVMNFAVQPLPDVAPPPATVARKLKMELLLGMAVNKESTAKTGSWRTRKPLSVDMLPPCTDKCPAGVKIRDYLELVETGKLNEARQLLLADNPLPAVTGRVCYHPCESGCNRKNFDTAVAVHAIERFIGDYSQETEIPVVASGAAKIAVIGSGPAGLSASYYLAQKQYNVTIFEALPVSGGMLRVGIPEYRLPGTVLDSEINRIMKMGVEIKNNITLGKDITVDELFEQGFKAVFIATGAHRAQALGIPGEDAKDVVPGVSFLRDIRLGKKVKPGAKTVVIGGGNVAVDAARSALRLDAKEVVIMYRRSHEEMPASDEEISACEAEGIKIEFLTSPQKILVQTGKVTGIECVRMKLGSKDQSGRRNPVPVSGSEFTIAADMVIPAVGQVPDIAFADGDKNIKIAGGGVIAVDAKNLATGRDGVYAGGDVVTGPATVVEAIAAGKKAALSIAAAINGQPVSETIKGEVIKYQDLNTDYFTTEPRQVEAELSAGKRKSGFKEVNTGLNESAVMHEAARCFHCGACNLCAVCSSLCPEGILTTDETTGWKPDLEQCKGCGICAVECPRGAVAMVLER
jgi:2-oxoacid:acceptor oxidoreductase gamma subunit (pyruvate/2-ketoisovalerate family)